MSEPMFKPGQEVELIETWPQEHVICRQVIARVGKRHVWTTDGDQYRLDGAVCGRRVSRWRKIRPVATDEERAMGGE